MPEDRKAKPKGQVKERFVKIVKVPCDDSQAIAEVNIPVEDGRAGDQLVSLLRVYFNQGKVKVDDVKGAATKQFTNQDINISQGTIDKLSDVGSVEVFPLSQPNEQNNHCKVSFYLDEVGQLKKLAPNKRATEFARLCGFQDVPFVGDMFIGRVGPQPESANPAPQNLDFSLSEYSSDAPWLKNVVEHNYQAGLAANKVAMESDLNDGTSAEEELEGGKVKWSETTENIELSVAIPSNISKFTAKDISVKFGASNVCVKVKNTGSEAVLYKASTVAPGDFLVLLDGDLAGGVVVNDCTWCINKQHVELTLEKSGNSQGAWRKLLK